MINLLEWRKTRSVSLNMDVTGQAQEMSCLNGNWCLILKRSWCHDSVLWSINLHWIKSLRCLSFAWKYWWYGEEKCWETASYDFYRKINKALSKSSNNRISLPQSCKRSNSVWDYSCTAVAFQCRSIWFSFTWIFSTSAFKVAPRLSTKKRSDPHKNQTISAWKRERAAACQRAHQ